MRKNYLVSIKVMQYQWQWDIFLLADPGKGFRGSDKLMYTLRKADIFLATNNTGGDYQKFFFTPTQKQVNCSQINRCSWCSYSRRCGEVNQTAKYFPASFAGSPNRWIISVSICPAVVRLPVVNSNVHCCWSIIHTRNFTAVNQMA